MTRNSVLDLNEINKYNLNVDMYSINNNSNSKNQQREQRLLHKVDDQLKELENEKIVFESTSTIEKGIKDAFLEKEKEEGWWVKTKLVDNFEVGEEKHLKNKLKEEFDKDKTLQDNYKISNLKNELKEKSTNAANFNDYGIGISNVSKIDGGTMETSLYCHEKGSICTLETVYKKVETQNTKYEIESTGFVQQDFKNNGFKIGAGISLKF